MTDFHIAIILAALSSIFYFPSVIRWIEDWVIESSLRVNTYRTLGMTIASICYLVLMGIFSWKVLLVYVILASVFEFTPFRKKQRLAQQQRLITKFN